MPAKAKVAEASRELFSVGVSGLDAVLGGGLTPQRFYVIEGAPGSGKTTLALQFLLAGASRGERTMYITMSESGPELHAVAASHGWSLQDVLIQDLVPDERGIDPSKAYTVFHPSEVELGSTTRAIYEAVESQKPTRVVLDSLSDLRLLSGNAFHYRQHVLSLKQFFVGRGCTALVLDDLAHAGQDLDAKSIAHGVVHLEQMNPEYGAERRRLRVRKYRGMRYRGGFHDFIIRRGGLTVFPRLIATETRAIVARPLIASGVKGLDTLLGGGLERGASTLITGAAGTGKSTIAATYAIAAAARGERAAIFLFDESIGTLIGRCRGLGLAVDKALADGRLVLEQVDPAELSPGQFTQRVVDVASEKNCTLVVLDSMNGFLQAMPDERYLVAQLHVILSYLGQRGIATVVISVQQGLIGHMTNPVDASYLADAVVLLRYFEAGGCVRQAISVIKRRGGRHERSIREMWMDASGLKVGEPLAKFQGVLTGVPSYLGSTSALAGARRG